MPNANDATVPAIDFNVPPLANAVTGVVRLRSGEEVPVRREGAIGGVLLREADVDDPRGWYISGARRLHGRDEEDIIAQVSVGPTGPGVYETVGGIARHFTHRDERGWRAVDTLGFTDDCGRAFFEAGSRCPEADLRRRIGDLPDAEEKPAAPAKPSYPADEGRAAMDALWGWGVPTVNEATREWLATNAVEAAAALAATFPAGCKGAAVLASCGGEGTVQWFGEPVVVVSRDDLRVLFDTMFREIEADFHGFNPNGVSTYPTEGEYGALSRAAAALGKTLPEWMQEHARKEGWA